MNYKYGAGDRVMTDQNEVKDLEVVEAPVPRQLTITEVNEIAQAFIKSGLFRDTQDQAKAVVKIMAGNELGIGPFAAMRGFNIIQGQLAPGANLIGALIKASGKYDYRVTESNEQKCHIEFFANGEKIGDSTYTMEDASRAGLTGKDNWRKYPRQMLFSRTLSEGGRMHCPDVFMGSVYVPEELEAIEGEWSTDTTPQAPRIASKVDNSAKPPVTLEAIKKAADKHRDAQGLLPPDKQKTLIGYLVETRAEKQACSDAQLGLLRGMLGKFFLSDAERHAWLEWMVGVKSTNDLTAPQVWGLLDWIAAEKDKDTDSWIPSKASIGESKLSLRQAMIDSGQLEMEMED